MFVLDVTYVLAKSMLCLVFAGAHILHHAFLTGDAINNPLCLAVQFSLDVYNNPSSSGFHHSHLQDKTHIGQPLPLLWHLCIPFKTLFSLTGAGLGILALIS